MSNRNRVGVRAQRIYEYLRDRQGQALRKAELLAVLELTDSKTTRSAIQRARELAEADGLYLTVPVYDNGYTMAVTDDASAAVDPAMFLARVGQGVEVPKHIADEFMRSRMEKLSPTDRAYLHLQDKIDAALSGAQAARDEIVRAQIELRREQRKADQGSATTS